MFNINVNVSLINCILYPMQNVLLKNWGEYFKHEALNSVMKRQKSTDWLIIDSKPLEL